MTDVTALGAIEETRPKEKMNDFWGQAVTLNGLLDALEHLDFYEGTKSSRVAVLDQARRLATELMDDLDNFQKTRTGVTGVLA